MQSLHCPPVRVAMEIKTPEVIVRVTKEMLLLRKKATLSKDKYLIRCLGLWILN